MISFLVHGLGASILNQLARGTHLAGFQEVKANVGVPGYRIQAVLAEVLVDIFRCRLGQEAVYALPNKKRGEATVSQRKNGNC